MVGVARFFEEYHPWQKWDFSFIRNVSFYVLCFLNLGRPFLRVSDSIYFIIVTTNLEILVKKNKYKSTQLITLF